MNIEITSEKKNPLLGRREIQFEIQGRLTPARADLKSELAKKLKAKDDMVVIDVVEQRTGYNVVTGRAKAYDDGKVMEKVELAYRSERDAKEKKEGEEAPAEKAPAEQKQEPKPEEKKEEKPEEKTAEDKKPKADAGEESSEKPPEEDEGGKSE